MQIIVCKRVLLLLPKSNEATKPKPGLTVASGGKKWLRNAVRIMKIAAILLLATCVQVTAAGHAQKISLSEKDAPIEKIFKKIERMTDYKFLYMSELLDNANKVTITVKDASVEQVLDLCLKEQILEYEIKETTIIIRPRTDLKSVATFNSPALGLIEVRGVITDENGAPAQGVNVVVKGSSKGTTTNLRGEFSLKDVDENAVLLISSVGYDRQEILVKNKAFITTQLKVAVGSLDELQVIAYGTTTKRFQTGNVSSIKAEDIQRQPITNPLLALQGRVTGVEITQSTGVPGSGVTVRIRGQNSLQNGLDPLYIIDGVPYSSQLLDNVGSILGYSGSTQSATAYGSPLSFINPSDIESIDILKDADATAIYGSRGANGVILITTKKGKAGKMKVDFNIQTGWGKVTRFLDVLNTRQYLDMRYEAFKNDGIDINTLTPDRNYDLTVWDTTRNINWQKELIGETAQYHNIQLAVSGGNNQTQYLISATTHKETSTFPGDFSNNNGSVNFNINSTSINQKFNIQLSANYTFNNNKLPGSDLTSTAVTLAPVAPKLYNNDGSLNWELNSLGAATFRNPLQFTLVNYDNKTSNLISNAVIKYKLLHELEIKTNIGYNKLLTNEGRFTPLTFYNPPTRLLLRNQGRKADYVMNTMQSWIIEPQLEYSKVMKNGKLTTLVGITIQQNKNDGLVLNAKDFNSDLVLKDIRSASEVSVGSTTASTYKYAALFGRINYKVKEKYLLNISARRDGSSRFGPEKQFHNFGALGVGWIFSSENFISNQLPFLSFGKLRFSYGTTGSDQVGDFAYMNLYSATSAEVPYLASNGLELTRHYNPDLEWEATRKAEAGLELGLWKDRILFSVSFYRNRSDNQLIDYELPAITGFRSVNKNLNALMQNQGWEFGLNTVNLHTDNLRWTSFFNISMNRNKIISVDSTVNIGYKEKVGLPVASGYLYSFAGVNSISGENEFLDNKGNRVSNPDFFADRTALIDQTPKFFGGLQNTISYKQFQLDFLFQFVKQIGQVYQYNFIPGFGPDGFGNQPVSVLNRWQKSGDQATIQKFSQDFRLYNVYSYAQSSNQLYGDASYIRLKNISLNWQAPASWVKAVHGQALKFYVHAQNVLTITKYKGLDPETRSSLSLPPLRVITAGIQVTF